MKIQTLTRREQLSWASGIFEGEGTFVSSPEPHLNGYRLQAKVKMTDCDDVSKFNVIMGFGSFYIHHPVTPNRKTQYVWCAQGFEGFQATVAYLWLGLGKRRRAAAIRILKGAIVYYANGDGRRGRKHLC